MGMDAWLHSCPNLWLGQICTDNNAARTDHDYTGSLSGKPNEQKLQDLQMRTHQRSNTTCN